MKNPFTKVFKNSFLKNFLLLIILSIPRFCLLEADPPLSLNDGFLPDEGYWAHNARNAVLTEQWIIGDFNPIYLSPVFSFFAYSSFKILGLGIFQARLVSAIAGALTIFFLFLLVKKAGFNKEAYLATFFLGINFVFIKYNRLVFPETLMTFFLILSLFLLQRGLSNKVYLFFSGISFALAYFSKAYAIFFVPILCALLLLRTNNEKGLRERSISFFWLLLGVLVLFVPLVFLVPDWDNFFHNTAMESNNNFPASLFAAFANMVLIQKSEFFSQIPIILLLVSFYVVSLIAKISNNSQKWDKLPFHELAAILWLFFGLLFLSVMNEHATRRFVTFIPPLSILAAVFIARVGKINFQGVFECVFGTKTKPFLQIIFLGLLLFPSQIILSNVMIFLGRYFDIQTGVDLGLGLSAATSLSLGFATLVVSLLVLALRRNATKAKLRYPLMVISLAVFFSLPFAHFIMNLTNSFYLEMQIFPKMSPDITFVIMLSTLILLAVAIPTVIRNWTKQRFSPQSFQLNNRVNILIVISYFIINFGPFMSSTITPRYTMLHISKDLGAYLKEGTVVMGTFASSLCFENKAISFHSREHLAGINKYFRFINANPIDRFSPDFIVAARSAYGRPVRWNVENDSNPDNLGELETYIRDAKLIKDLKLIFDQNSGSYDFVFGLYKLPKY